MQSHTWIYNTGRRRMTDKYFSPPPVKSQPFAAYGSGKIVKFVVVSDPVDRCLPKFQDRRPTR